ncbi:MAG TPA: 16S rRNA (adenine(1518)-N(6)/adenine(1519)-N(6))-dimethyltransferase RsmA [Vicinamibacterales bacterium]|jgi:16S rRNA (adenine1518-N6/adenine1519-N6)-dimethyltransferase|nr:16S rRNA (adenine(1518)-N(6)/adenine(1519)-N(6))-dimethyltransferase RsmA [Vicinamibacterales bacterium]
MTKSPIRGRPPRARKRFGQHFLEPAWVARLVDSLSPSPDDVFLEVGPGRGALTVPLAGRVRRIVAVEIDRDLAGMLQEQRWPNVMIEQADFLDVDVHELLRDERKPVRVVGNLPYNVSSPILFKLLHAAAEGRAFSDATLMLQKEVADRLAAVPGTKAYGTLAIQVSLLADVERVLTLPPGAFRPPPKVMSAVVRLRFRPAREDVGDLATFERLVRGIFLQRRKRLLNALKPVADSLGRSAADLITAAGVDGTKRPEELSLRDIAQLSRAML